MAKISTYPETPPPALDDFLLGTDVSNDNATQNFLVSDIVDLVSTASSSYKVYSALLTQTGENAPVPIVLENSSNMVVNFERNFTGEYYISSLEFVRGKTIINGVNPYLENTWELSQTSVDFPVIKVGGGPTSTNREIRIPSTMSTTGTNIIFQTIQNNISTDGVLSKLNAFIEIKVYN